MVSYTLQNNEADSYNIKNYAASSSSFIQSNPLGDHNISNYGTFALEYKVNNFYDSPIVGDEYISSGYWINFSEISNVIRVGIVMLTNDNSGLNLVYFTQDSNGGNTISHKYPLSSPLPQNFRFGLYLNQESKQIGLNVNGVDKGYLSNFSGNINKIGIAAVSSYARVNSNNIMIGKLISSELITDSPKYLLKYPASAKDICGVAL